MPDPTDSPFEDIDAEGNAHSSTDGSTPSKAAAERPTPANGERSAVGHDQAAIHMGDSGTLAHLLAEEFRQDKPSAAIRRQLHSELAGESASDGPGLKRLQQRVSDIEAYVDALEIVLDEDSDGQQKLRGFADSLDALKQDLDRVDDDLSETETTLAALESDPAELADDIEAIIDRRDRLREEQTRLESAVDSIEADLDRLDDLNDRNQSLEEDIEEIREHIDGLSAFTDRLSTAMDGMGN